MQEDNLEPGPLAYNTLVVAHIKAGDLDAAFDVLQNLQYQGQLPCIRSHAAYLLMAAYVTYFGPAGLQPVPQTYCALIHSSVRDGQLKQAEEVLQQMQDSRISAYSGWLVITKQLWAKGHIDLAQNYLKERPKEWRVDGDLYEHAIRQVCLDPSNDASYLLHPNFVEHVVSASGQSEMRELPAEANEVSPEGTVQKIWANMQVRPDRVAC